jgi:SAM-dependent methyltransferase
MSPDPTLVFDRGLMRARQQRASALDAPTFLIRHVAQDLSDRLATVLRRFERAADLGTCSDALCRELAQSGKVGNIVRTAASMPCLREGKENAEHVGPPLLVAADEEALPFRDASLDLLVSGLALQFLNDLPGTLVQVRRALKADGLLLAAVVGGDSLIELRQSFAVAEGEIEGGISPRVIPFLDVRTAGTLLQRAGFALPVTDVERIIVRYETPMALMHDLRAMGATNPMVERSRSPLKRATLMRMMQVYAERFADPDSRIRATFDIVWLSGWAPHSSQQKPLAPGSARQRLADALGAREHSAGERAGERTDGRRRRTEDR